MASQVTKRIPSDIANQWERKGETGFQDSSEPAWANKLATVSRYSFTCCVPQIQTCCVVHSQCLQQYARSWWKRNCHLLLNIWQEKSLTLHHSHRGLMMIHSSPMQSISLSNAQARWGNNMIAESSGSFKMSDLLLYFSYPWYKPLLNSAKLSQS